MVDIERLRFWDKNGMHLRRVQIGINFLWVEKNGSNPETPQNFRQVAKFVLKIEILCPAIVIPLLITLQYKSFRTAKLPTISKPTFSLYGNIGTADGKPVLSNKEC